MAKKWFQNLKTGVVEACDEGSPRALYLERAKRCLSRDASARTAIYEDVTPDGGGGGSQPAVTDGTTTVAMASSIHFPDATVADGGGGAAVVTFQTLVQTTVIGHDDILTLPTTMVEVLPATETPNGGPLTTLPVPISGLAIGPLVNYDNDHAAELDLVWGSDYSAQAAALTKNGAVYAPLALFGSGSAPVVMPFGLFDVQPPWGMGSGFHDNGLYLYLDNGGMGDFSGGDPENKLTIRIVYLLVDVT